MSEARTGPVTSCEPPWVSACGLSSRVVTVGAKGYLSLSCQSVNTDGWRLMGTRFKQWKCAGFRVTRTARTWGKPFQADR